MRLLRQHDLYETEGDPQQQRIRLSLIVSHTRMHLPAAQDLVRWQKEEITEIETGIEK